MFNISEIIVVPCACEVLHLAPLEYVGTSTERREGLISRPKYGTSEVSGPWRRIRCSSRTRADSSVCKSLRARDLADGSSSYRGAFAEFHIVHSTERN
ncbi:hypothetical protein PUN28_006195 [Cardiocondyla obscurior]|uniref:Uncharacterized protein n=1 Tax=Cardiocondyla obscurior TaxID=286306 RepID=A0AAW2G9A4_9HYME